MEEGLVSVDKFSGGSQAYFLTHLHQDHTRGLGAVGGWRHGPLYCSPTTARLLPIRFPGIDASLLRPLAPGASASIYLFSPSSGQSLSLHVTAIPALHCPGSLMYLFRGDLGCMLYTGDFRWELGCDEARRAKQDLLDALDGDTIDVLYLDNTYCHPSLNFPPRPVVAEQVIDIIRSHPDHEVIIGVDTLGKEDLLLHISRALQTKTSLTRIRAVPRYSVTIDNLEALNTVCPTIGILPSAIPCLWKSSEGKAKSKGRSSVKSIRSSGRELEDFMHTVRPWTVSGIVSSSFCYVNPRHHFRHLCLDNNVNDETDMTPIKNKGRDNDKLTPKRWRNGSVTPKERKVRISSSSLYRSKVTMKRKECCGARINDTEEHIGVT
uniref:DNA repair metallo-beta-lactamase domain-containing protein n=1 Tax=Zea mays TaxID=4577 RepID=A0A804R126_MAIZE